MDGHDDIERQTCAHELVQPHVRLAGKRSDCAAVF
jgi:hypothetical protein